ncbi:hypothetical protein EBZ97_03910 [bacterium]|nr:hypothetical protein [bacterium]
MLVGELLKPPYGRWTWYDERPDFCVTKLLLEKVFYRRLPFVCIVTEHAGGYTDWRNEVERIANGKRGQPTAAKATPPAPETKPAAGKSVKLSNKDRQDIIELPGKIAELEAEQSKIAAQLADPEVYKNGGALFAELQKRLQTIDAEHNVAMQRWLELESRQG